MRDNSMKNTKVKNEREAAQRSVVWARRDSNSQSARNRFLRPARIPIPPRAHRESLAYGLTYADARVV